MLTLPVSVRKIFFSSSQPQLSLFLNNLLQLLSLFILQLTFQQTYHIYISKCSQAKLRANITVITFTLIKCYKPRRVQWCLNVWWCRWSGSSRRKCEVTKRQVPQCVSFNLHPFWNWLHFQAYYGRRGGSWLRVATQGHESHPRVPEWVLGVGMQRGG